MKPLEDYFENKFVEEYLKFIDRNMDKQFDWGLLSNNALVTDEYIQNNLDKPWNLKSKRRDNLSEPPIEFDQKTLCKILSWNNLSKLDKLYWCELSKNSNITWDIIKENINKPWKWSYISLNPNITYKIVKNNPDIKWDWTRLSMNININLSIIKNDPDKNWNWNWVSGNENITFENIEKNTDKPWNWLWISGNNMSFGKKRYIKLKIKTIAIFIFSFKEINKDSIEYILNFF